MRVAVVVLAGGGSRRWDGRDKTAAVLAGRTVLEHAVLGLVSGAGVGLGDAVVVAPAGHPAAAALRAATWTREDPAGGGPVAGLAAAVAVLDPDVDVLLLGAGDAPFAGDAARALLDAVAPGPDAAVGVDPGGREQPLLGAYRVPALRAALPASGGGAGARLRDVVARLRPALVPVGARAALDLDTPADLAAAERLL